MSKDYLNVPQIELEALQFEDLTCGGRLLGTLRLGQLGMHVEAIRVTSEAGEQESWHEHEAHLGNDMPDGCYCVEQLEALYKLDSEGPFTTTEIEGFEGEWVLVATPFK